MKKIKGFKLLAIKQYHDGLNQRVCKQLKMIVKIKSIDKEIKI